MKRAALLLVVIPALAACGEQAAAPDDQSRAASGEVLPGSTSDAMIPLEQLESVAPLAPRQGPTAEELDAEQPVVTPAPGADEGPAPSEEAGAASAPPASAPAPAG